MSRPSVGPVDRDSMLFGGAERDRTADLRLAKPALSHLSYCPTSFHRWVCGDAFYSGRKGNEGLDLPLDGVLGRKLSPSDRGFQQGKK